MNILDQAKHIPHGAKVISAWLGSGGDVVDKTTAQARACTCVGPNNPTHKRCELNVDGFKPTEAVAAAVKQYLSVKNGLGLKVHGEKELGTCSACGCQLRLLVWLPQDKVQREMADDERAKLPHWCWKIL